MNWQPYAEPISTTLRRTLGIALGAGLAIALFSRGAVSWPVGVLIAFWPSFGGHWVELWFLNWLRPQLPAQLLVQRLARIALWLTAGVAFVLLMTRTASLATGIPRTHVPLWVGGVAFIGVELVAHLALQLRGRPSFYNGRG